MKLFKIPKVVDLGRLVTEDALTQWLPYHWGRVGPDEEHLREVIGWLKRSHEVTGRQGSSAGYSLLHGWRSAYPETTGYLIPTFLKYAARYGDEDAMQQAIVMAEWELSVQYDSGGIPGSRLGPQNRQPVVFNTGQVIFGFLAAYQRSGRTEFLRAACRAGDFLLGCQDDTGCFVRHTYRGIPHTYNTRTAWSLLSLHRISGDERYLKGARRNLEWALLQQESDGWLRHNQFSPGMPVNMHGLAYAAEGFVEAYMQTGDRRYLEAGERVALQVLRLFEAGGKLPAELDAGWRPLVSYSCVTGNIQFAIIWMRLHQLLGHRRFFDAACEMITWAKRLHRLGGVSAGVRGAVKGSHPVFGRYQRFQFPNWAAKFFADALMLKLELSSRPQAMSPHRAKSLSAGEPRSSWDLTQLPG